MKVEISGLKCDNEFCDYSDPDIKVEDYHLYVNKACPCCGENLLTQEDFDAVEKLLDAEHLINYHGLDREDDTQISTGLKFDGSGELKISYMAVMPGKKTNENKKHEGNEMSNTKQEKNVLFIVGDAGSGKNTLIDTLADKDHPLSYGYERIASIDEIKDHEGGYFHHGYSGG